MCFREEMKLNRLIVTWKLNAVNSLTKCIDNNV